MANDYALQALPSGPGPRRSGLMIYHDSSSLDSQAEGVLGPLVPSLLLEAGKRQGCRGGEGTGRRSSEEKRKGGGASALPDPALPPQVKGEEGRRQGCARAVLRRKQFEEAVACKARGSCLLPKGVASVRREPRLPWGRPCPAPSSGAGAAAGDPWSRRHSPGPGELGQSRPGGCGPHPHHLALVFTLVSS